MWNKLTDKLRRSLNPRLYPKSRTSNIRLAITGCSHAGKTVFVIGRIKSGHWWAELGSRG